MRKINPASVVTGGVLASTLLAGMLATAPAALASPTPDPLVTSYDVIATVGIAPSVSGLAVDPAHNSAYVVSPNENLVSVLDLTTNTVTATIPVGAYPFRVAVDPGLDRAYVTNHDDSTISVIDTVNQTIIDTIYLPANPRGIGVDPTTHKIYVAIYWGGENMVVIDPTTSPATLDQTGYLGSRPWAVAVDPTTHQAYVSTLFGDTVSVVTGTTIGPVIGGFRGPTEIKLDPSTHRAYVFNANGPSVVDTTTNTVTGILASGSGASDMAIDTSTGIDYVSNYNDDTVSVVDQTTNTAIATVPVGHQPVAMDIDPTTHLVYALNDDGTVSVIAPRSSQDITFTSLAPTGATVGDTYTVSATGGASGRPVTFSVDPATTNSACSVTGTVVSFDHAGTCVLAADQVGSTYYAPATTATQPVTVGLVQTTTTISVPTGVVHGQAAIASVAVTGTHQGVVQFSLDGTPLGSPVALDTAGAASTPDLAGLGLVVGANQIGAVFTPTDTNRYAASTATPQTLTVSKAATASSVSVSSSEVTTTVSPVLPGAGTPTGTVHFYVSGSEVGTAQLTNGTAALAYGVPAGSTQQVSVVYAGDSAFTGSSATTARRDPVITASVSSSKARHLGWYAGPVTMTFHCQATSAALTAACPAPVTLTRNAAGQSVTRTVMAVDGGVATVAVSGINIDTVRPVARVTGVRAGATYFATGPAAHCRGTDSLSGVASCTVTRTTHGRQVAYVATATDMAGNRASTRLTARITNVTISGAAMSAGRYVVHSNRTYTILVASTKRPTYVYAAPTPQRPAGGNTQFHRVGKNRWALGVTFTGSMSHHTWWNIGTRVGSHTTVTTVHVVR